MQAEHARIENDLREALWLLRGDGFAKADGTGFCLDGFPIKSYREVREEEAGRMISIKATVEYYCPIPYDFLTGTRRIELRGLSWRAARVHHKTGIRRFISDPGEEVMLSVEITLVAYSNGNGR